jgi:ABC-type transport system involved in cytochrome c biogenesis permease subunit
MGVLYLVQERELKSRSPHRFYYLLPSLERCDTISGRSVAIGLAFLTLAILTGLLWSHTVHGRYWTADPKEWSAVIAWFLYVGLLAARRRAGWGGRQAAWLGIAGFLVVVFTFFWTTLTSGVVRAAR